MTTPPRPDPDSARLVYVEDDPDAVMAYAEAVSLGFHEELKDDERETWVPRIEPARSFGFMVGERWVATCGAFSRRIVVPGGQLDVAAVSEVTVAPGFRRRGLLGQMMRHQLQEVADRGESLAYLWASEQAIYGRYGYGQSVPRVQVLISTQRSAFDSRVDLGDGFADEVPVAEARDAAAALYDRVHRSIPGHLDRTAYWWDARLADGPTFRDGAGPLRAALHWDSSGRVDGYAFFRVKEGWGDDGPDARLGVLELVAEPAPARARLWRFLLDTDLVRTLRARGTAPDEPMLTWLAGPDCAKREAVEGTQLRVVDVPTALSARRYAAEVDEVLELRDDLLPGNAGRWRLRGGPDGAEVARVDSSPAVSMDVRDLGAIYLGGPRLQSWVRAGLVTAHEPAGLARLSTAFGWDRAPQCIDPF